MSIVTHSPITKGDTFHGAIYSALTRGGDRTFLRDQTERWNNQDILSFSQRIHHIISSLAKSNRAPVAIMARNSAKAVSVALGALFSGRAYSFFDPIEKDVRIRNRLNVLCPSVVIDVDGLFCDFISGFPFPATSLKDGIPETAETKIIFEPNGIAYVLFTSGSTGHPRGIAVGHRASVLARKQYLCCTGLQASDQIVSDIPLIFDVSTLDVMGGLAAGACVNMANASITETEGELFSLLQETCSVSAFTVPTVADMIFSSSSRLPKLRNLLLTGELVGARLAARLKNLGINTINAYGMTEAPWITTGRLSDGRNILDMPSLNDPVSIRISNDGEILISGEGLFSGFVTPFYDYTNDPGPEPEYQTGDYGKLLKNGKIQLLGRRDRHIRHDGYRVELGEIESLIETGADDVLACATYDISKKQISVGIAPKSKSTLIDLEAIRAQSSDRIPYFMFPHHWYLLDELPRTITGKKNYLTARELAAHD